MPNDSKPFYMLYANGRTKDTKKFDTEEQASEAAVNMVREHGQEIFVLKCIRSVKLLPQPIDWTEYSTPKNDSTTLTPNKEVRYFTFDKGGTAVYSNQRCEYVQSLGSEKTKVRFTFRGSVEEYDVLNSQITPI